MLDNVFNWLEKEISNSPTCIYEFDIRDVKHMSNEIGELHNSLMSIHNKIAQEQDENFRYLETNRTTVRYKGKYYNMGYFHHEVAAFYVRYLIEKPDEFYDLTPEVKDKKSPRALYILINQDKYPETPDIKEVSKLTAKWVSTYIKKYNNEEINAWLKSECKVEFLVGPYAYVYNWMFNHGGQRLMDKNETQLVVAGISNKDRIEPLMKYYKIWF